MSELEVVRAGTVPYEEAWERQRALHAARVAGEGPDTLLLLEHPSVYTAGKRTEPHERPQDGTPVVDVDRGGKITWHGPGQLVGYPIVRENYLRRGAEHDLPEEFSSSLFDLLIATTCRLEDELMDELAENGRRDAA